MTLGRSGVLSLAAAIVVLATPAVATAAPTWLAPVDLSATSLEVTYPQVAVDPQGDVTAVWRWYDGTNSVVQSASRPAGGPWAAPVTLSAPGQTVSEVPALVVDDQGNATAAWVRSNGSDSIVQTASRPVGGAWSAPVDLSAPGLDAGSPQLAVDGQGTVTAAWVRGTGSDFVLQSAVRAADGAWSAPADVSPAGEGALDPHLAVNASGTAIAVWVKFGGSNLFVKSATRAVGGAWSAPVAVSDTGQNAAQTWVTIDGHGNATAMWTRNTGITGAAFIVQSASRSVGGAWSAPVVLTPAFPDLPYPQVEVDAQGNATAIWGSSTAGGAVVQSAMRPAGGSWTAPIDLSASGPATPLADLALDEQGNATAVWQSVTGSSPSVQTSRRAAGGTWTAPVAVGSGGGPSVAVDGQGNAAAAWINLITGGGETVARAAGFDGAGPLLRSVQIPTTGVTGQPRAFSVSPLDVWSALGATTWNFGDGGTATGLNVSHTYTAPGTYTVRLTGTDAVGNATTLTREVVVSAAPPLTLTDVSATPRCIGTGPGAGPDIRISSTLSDAAQVTYTLQRRTTPGLVTPRTCPSPLAPGAKLVDYSDVGSPTSIAAGAGAGYATVSQTGAITRTATTHRRHQLVRTVSGRAGRARISLLRTLRATGTLPPGRYRVLIEAVRADGARSQQATVRFWVLRPKR